MSKKAKFYLFKVTAWALAAYCCFEFAALVEAVFSYGSGLSTKEILFTGAQAKALVFSSNISLISEPIFVYLILALAGFSAFMFIREMLAFQKHLSSLVISEDKSLLTGVNV